MRFPRDLARVVFGQWQRLITGDYTAPPCPPERLLRQLLETCFLASCSAEEGRLPLFNVAAFDQAHLIKVRNDFPIYEFLDRRRVTVAELRRLAPAVDLKKSAICCVWNDKGLFICGLMDLGTSWHRARVGLEYNYNSPACLLIQIDRPGRLRIYQGSYRVATLSDGVIADTEGYLMHLFLHEAAISGLERMATHFDYPVFESPREYREFEFMAIWNVYAAIANSISLLGHGGAIVLCDKIEDISSCIKIKYEVRSNETRDRFISFLNARHKIADYISLDEDGHFVPQSEILQADITVDKYFQSLVEAIRFTAQLSNCDGATIISNDLCLYGFGTEIKAELQSDVSVFEVKDEFRGKREQCDVEEFGMRHRSAVKLVSQSEGCRVLVISQDGPISAIWREKGAVFVKKGVNLANMNMPLG